MKENILPTPDFSFENHQNNPLSGKDRKKWIRILYFCSIGGVFFGLSGLLLSGLAFFDFLEKEINRIGTLFVITAFPLLIFSAHAVDKIREIDRKEKSKNIETARKRQFYSPEQWKDNDSTKS